LIAPSEELLAPSENLLAPSEDYSTELLDENP
jgi:hypothetical protein